MKNQSFIIIVDDDESVRRSLCRLLRSLNFEADAFSSANEFLEILPDIMPDCLILDVRMPKVNGLNLQKELANRNYKIPIIFITAYEDEQTSVQAMKAGAVAFIQKPFNEQVLLEAIHSALGQQA